MRNEPDEKEPDTWSVRPDDEMRKRMELAQKATGRSRSALIIECILKQLPNVVSELSEERRSAEKEFEQITRRKPARKAPSKITTVPPSN